MDIKKKKPDKTESDYKKIRFKQLGLVQKIIDVKFKDKNLFIYL